MSRTRLTLALAAAVAAAALGCTESVVSQPASYEVVVEAHVSAAAWAGEDDIVFSADVADQTTTEFGLWSTDLASSPIPIQLQRPEGCDRRDVLQPTRAPGGRVAVLDVCIKNGRWMASLGLLAADRADIEPVFDLAELGAVNAAQFAFADDPPSRGVTATGSRICQGLVWITRDGVRPIPAAVTLPDGEFRLDDDFSGRGCADTGLADHPDWSPVTDEIAFFAADARGRDGPGRFDVPGAIVLMDAATLTTSVLVPEVSYPDGLAWSPDGTQLALAGRIGDEGLWLIDREGGATRRIVPGPVRKPAWSPDGSSIAFLQPVGDLLSVRIAVVDAH